MPGLALEPKSLLRSSDDYERFSIGRAQLGEDEPAA
jgi:hypothetical protein